MIDKDKWKIISIPSLDLNLLQEKVIYHRFLIGTTIIQV